LLKRPVEDTSGGITFIQLKQTLEAVEKGGGLVVPSRSVVRLVAEMEDVFYQHIPSIFTGELVCDRLKSAITASVDVQRLLRTHDEAHKATLATAFVEAYLVVRINHFCKQKMEAQKLESRTRRAAGQSKRRIDDEKAFSKPNKLKRMNIVL
jgi:hypothetical protein